MSHKYGALSIWEGGQEESVVARDVSRRLRLVWAAGVVLVSFLFIVLIISPQNFAPNGRKTDKLYVSMNYPSTYVTSETTELLGDGSAKSKLDDVVSYKQLPSDLKGKRHELSDDLIALRKLAGGDQHAQGPEIIATSHSERAESSTSKALKQPVDNPIPSTSKASAIIASAQREISKVSKLDGGAKRDKQSNELGFIQAGLAQKGLAQKGLAELTQKGAAELREAVEAPVQPKPFASDKKWSVAKQKSDMDKWFDNLDKHATTRAAAKHSEVAHSAKKAVEQKHKEPSTAATEAKTMTLAESPASKRSDLSGQTVRKIEENYFDREVSQDKAARSKLHAKETLATATHKMSDIEARKDELSFYSELEGAAKQQRKGLMAQEHKEETAALRRVTARHKLEAKAAAATQNKEEEQLQRSKLSSGQARSGLENFFTKEMNKGKAVAAKPGSGSVAASENKLQEAHARLQAKHARESGGSGAAAQHGARASTATAPSKSQH